MNKRKVPKIRFKGFYDDWEQRKLSEMCGTFEYGLNAAAKEFDGKNKYIRITDIDDASREFLLSDLSSPDICLDGMSKYILSSGDIVFARTGASVGKTYIYRENDGIVYFAGFLIRAKVNQDNDAEFVFQSTLSPSYEKYIRITSQRSGQPGVNAQEYGEYDLFAPSKEEQQRIGHFLRGIDNLITLHQKKCFEWKKSGFSSASISWEQRKFGEVFMSLQNNTLSRAELNDEFGIAQNIHYGDVLIKYDDVLDVSKEPLSYIEKQSIADKFKTSYLQNGDVIIADTAEDETVGKCTEIEGLTDQKVISGLHTMPVRPNRKFAAGFLGFYLNSAAYHDQLKPLMQGIKVTSISKGAMQDTVVKFPLDLKEQEQIGMYFSGLDHLITLHQRKLELLERLRNSLANRCFIGEKCTMSKLILYHGSPNRVIVPKFGFGEDRHDYGRGFYLTENLELAKEWAVCRPDETNGWVHKYELEMEGLNILDFQKYDVLSWLAELMKHRDAADSRRYKMLAQKFIEKYGIDTCGYDVITGWRANASYFYIAKEFVRDNIDIEILEELLSLGGLGIQFCIKSERAFAQLSEVEQDIMSVDYSEFNDRYNSGTTICRAARS